MTTDSFKWPQGVAEFEVMAAKVIEASGLPDNDSVRWALATAILHFPQAKPEATIEYFASLLQKGACNQVAAQVIQDLKAKQEAAKQAEVTAQQAESASDGQTPNQEKH